MIQLRPRQQMALDMLRRALASGSKRLMIQAPTGFGKTELAAAIVQGALRKGRRVVFTVPAIELVDQTAQRFFKYGIHDVGVLQADHPMTNPSRPVQIASMDTLARRFIPEADIVLIDEAHRKSAFLEGWMTRDEWLAVPFVGLSATPWTKGLGRLYDRLLIPATTQQLIDEGLLSPFKVFAPSHPDLSKVRTLAGDYREDQLSAVMTDKALVADVVSTWLAKGEGRPTLCFAVDRVHAQTLQAQFLAAGVGCGYVDGETPKDERKEVARKFASGEYQVVCNVGVLTTGVDWDVRCVILARPTKSEILYTQVVGRGLRTAPGKSDCLARDTLVLTDAGEVKIQDVTREHLVWDGQAFVRHGGAICKGVQPVMTYDGLTATPDHRVMTDDGWVSFAEAARRCLRIARTGVGGLPLRFAGDHLAADAGLGGSAEGRGAMRSLCGDAHGNVPQHQEAAGDRGLPALQWAAAGDGAALAVSALPSSAGSLPKPESASVSGLRRPGDRVPLCGAERGGVLGSGEPWDSGEPPHATRSDRQRRPLRAGQSPLGSPSPEHEQHAQGGRFAARAVPADPNHLPVGDVFGCDAGQIDPGGDERRADHRAMGRAVVQAEGEVWDLVNAGPLQRFTANGRLVHNCLILDHSDTTLRLGFVTDIHHERLDDGTLGDKADAKPQDAEPAKPKECPKCHHLRPAKMHVCPSCGHVPEKVSRVEVKPGELVDATEARRQLIAQQVAFMAQLRKYQQAKGKTDGWVLSRYRAKYNSWPDCREVREAQAAASITPEVQRWLQSQNIRQHHRRAKQGVAA